MAQQTQAARAAEAWTAWMARWPTVASLAAAPVADVLRAWRGLGYNRRALNLHRAAQTIVAEHGGRGALERGGAWRRLPGVGPYTARAVAAIAFRGAGRGGGYERPARARADRRPAAPRPTRAGSTQALADATVPRDRPDAWTHALMDLGRAVRRPARPQLRRLPGDRLVPVRGGERATPAPAISGTASPSRARVPHSTTRWLRGRILDQARVADDGEWIPFRESIGEHGTGRRPRAAVVASAREGLLDARETPTGWRPASRAERRPTRGSPGGPTGGQRRRVDRRAFRTAGTVWSAGPLSVPGGARCTLRLER